MHVITVECLFQNPVSGPAEPGGSALPHPTHAVQRRRLPGGEKGGHKMAYKA